LEKQIKEILSSTKTIAIVGASSNQAKDSFKVMRYLQNSGYKTEVRKINSNGKRLHAVRIERYQSKTEAEKIGRSLKSKFGLDFRVINSPK